MFRKVTTKSYSQEQYRERVVKREREKKKDGVRPEAEEEEESVQLKKITKYKTIYNNKRKEKEKSTIKLIQLKRAIYNSTPPAFAFTPDYIIYQLIKEGQLC